MTVLPQDSQARKDRPMCSGLLDYFPAALAEVALVSLVGNEKHNPGQELHHSRGNSMDHVDGIVRHLIERGGTEVVILEDGRSFVMRHTAYLAWRALALLQQELEDAGESSLPRGAR